MKVWVVERTEYDEGETLGVFSSEEKAKEAMEHWRENSDKWHKNFWYDYNEYSLDEYHNKHLTKLHKALR